MMLNNAETLRCARMELSLDRMVVVPAVGLLTVLAAWYGGHPEMVGSVAKGWLWLCAFWGVQATCLSVMDEVGDGTWEQQLLSHERAWDLLLGKWLGSTLYCWYGVGWGIAIGLPCGLPMSWVSLFVLVTLNAQALGVLFSYASAMRLRQVRRVRVTGLRQGAVLIAAFLIGVSAWLLMQANGGHLSAARVFESACLWLPWPILIAHRLVRIELQEPVTPTVWLALTGFTIWYAWAFVEVNDAHAYLLTLLALVPMTYTYLTCFCERFTPMRASRLLGRFAAREWRQLWCQLPVSWLLALLSAGGGIAAGLYLWLQGGDAAATAVQILPILTLFAIRDWFLMVYIQLVTPAHKPSDTPTLVTFTLLYVVAPFLAALAGLKSLMPLVWAFGLDDVRYWHPLPSLLVVAILLARKVRRGVDWPHRARANVRSQNVAGE